MTDRKIGGLSILQPATISHLNCLFYGVSGVGKTVLAGSASDVPEMHPVLFIDVEGGTLSLKGTYPEVDSVRVQNWADMQKVYDALYRGQHDYKTVVLDSLTEIQKFSMYNIMRDLVRERPDRDPDLPGMQEWGKNAEQIRRLVRAFRDLPVHTIFTALVALDKDPKTNLVQARPGLTGKLSQEVAGFVDIVTYLYTKQMDQQIRRLMLTVGTDRHIAKDRTGKLPEVIEEPTMQKIYDLAFLEEQ
jgi:hypothetical protein